MIVAPPAACRSGGVQQVALGGLEKQGELKGMDEAVFSAAPPEAMRGLLQVGGLGWVGLTNVQGSSRWGGGVDEQALLLFAKRLDGVRGLATCAPLPSYEHCPYGDHGPVLAACSTARSAGAACVSSWHTSALTGSSRSGWQPR